MNEKVKSMRLEPPTVPTLIQLEAEYERAKVHLWRLDGMIAILKAQAQAPLTAKPEEVKKP